MCLHPNLIHRFSEDGDELFCPACGAKFVEVENQIPDPEPPSWYWEDEDERPWEPDDPFPALLLSELDYY